MKTERITNKVSVKFIKDRRKNENEANIRKTNEYKYLLEENFSDVKKKKEKEKIQS